MTVVYVTAPPPPPAPVLVVTPELREALDRITATSSCPRYLRDAWAAAARQHTPAP